MNKQLIIPVPTPAGIAPESQLITNGMNGHICLGGHPGEEVYSAMANGATDLFHAGCRAILERFRGYVDGVFVGGTTGEGVCLRESQYETCLGAMKQACPTDIPLYAGVLGLDVIRQMQIAQELGYTNLVLGIHHLGDVQKRIDDALAILDTGNRLLLYSLPTFPTPDQAEIISILQREERIVGYKTGNTDFLLSLIRGVKSERPNFQIYHGSEEGLAQADDEVLDGVDGGVAGTGNINPELLRRFMDNPRDVGIVSELTQLQNTLKTRSLRSRDNNNRFKPQVPIWRYIHAIKLTLMEMGILTRQEVAMYSDPENLFAPQESA